MIKDKNEEMQKKPKDDSDHINNIDERNSSIKPINNKNETINNDIKKENKSKLRTKYNKR